MENPRPEKVAVVEEVRERLAAANVHTVIDELIRAKPAASKGRYIRSVTLSSTMGPGVRIDPARARELEEELAPV